MEYAVPIAFRLKANILRIHGWIMSKTRCSIDINDIDDTVSISKTNFNIIKLICISALSVQSILYIVRYRIDIISPSLNTIIMKTLFCIFLCLDSLQMSNSYFRRYRQYWQYRIDVESYMYTIEAMKLSLINARHFFTFYCYWQYCINIYHFIILKHLYLYIIRHCYCFTCTLVLISTTS